MPSKGPRSIRKYVASAPSPSVVAAKEKAVSAGRAPPLLFDKPRHEQAVIGALAELKTGWGHEQAAVAAAASCSTEPGAAKEPNLWGRMRAPDGEEVPLPPNIKRKRTDESDEAVWDPMALQRWHDNRQKVESSAVAGEASSAVAGKESSAVAGNGGMIVVDSQEENNEEVSSQATTLHLGSPAKRGYVCRGKPLCEDIDCDCEDVCLETEFEDEEGAPRHYEILSAKLWPQWRPWSSEGGW